MNLTSVTRPAWRPELPAAKNGSYSVPAPGLPGSLARLYETAIRLGITVLDDTAAPSPWPDENTAAIVSFGEHIALKSGLDDGLRTDVLAMA